MSDVHPTERSGQVPEAVVHDRAAPLCRCSCEEHVGEFELVRVIHEPSGTDWGAFRYCEAAILEDQSRGLTVIRSVDEQGEST